jgi:hypothetical protein
MADLSQPKSVLHQDTTSAGGVKAFLRHDHTIRSSSKEEQKQKEDAFHAKMIQKAKETRTKQSSLLASTPPLVLDSKSRPSNSTTNTNKNVVVLFQGWARCFFQGRKDVSAQQLTRPKKICHTPYVDNYLLIRITSSSSSSFSLAGASSSASSSSSSNLRLLLLHIYADAKDAEHDIPLVNPPIDLRHFYAATIPTSYCGGAALFLKEDDRYFHRYLFRFEFYNGTILQKGRNVEQLLQFGSAIRKRRGTRINSSSSSALVRNVLNKKQSEKKEGGGAAKFYTSSTANEDETLLLFKAYRETVHELCCEASNQADDFITAVNQCVVTDEDAFTAHGPRSWGPAYDDEENSRRCNSSRRNITTNLVGFQDLELFESH